MPALLNQLINHKVQDPHLAGPLEDARTFLNQLINPTVSVHDPHLAGSLGDARTFPNQLINHTVTVHLAGPLGNARPSQSIIQPQRNSAGSTWRRKDILHQLINHQVAVSSPCWPSWRSKDPINQLINHNVKVQNPHLVGPLGDARTLSINYSTTK